jgi:hypothetical protein
VFCTPFALRSALVSRFRVYPREFCVFLRRARRHGLLTRILTWRYNRFLSNCSCATIVDQKKKEDLRSSLAQLRADIYREIDLRVREVEAQLDTLSEELTTYATTTPNVILEASQAGALESELVSKVSNEIGDQVVEEVVGKLEEHFSEQIAQESKASRKKIRTEFDQLRSRIQKTNIIWSTMVIIGGWLTWYGAWGIIGKVPVLQQPVVALLCGIMLLTMTGAVYRKLVG